MSEQNLSLEVVKGKINMELTATNYQKLLQDAENIHFTRDNIGGEYGCLKALRDVLKKAATIKTEGKKPYLDACKAWDNAYNSIIAPIEDVLARKTSEFTQLATSIQRENQEAENEKKRVSDIKTLITNKKIEFGNKASNATSLNELVLLEKAIGSEKNRTGTYQEFIKELISSLDDLRPIIKLQKENIQRLNQLADESKKAHESGDDQKLLDLETEKELANQRIEESRYNVQSTALQSNGTDVATIEAEPIKTVKPRRTTIAYEITDALKLQKKHPNFFTLTPVDSEIKEWLKGFKSDFEKSDNSQVLFDGIRVYKKELY